MINGLKKILKMILAVDIGNSNIYFGVMEDGEIIHSWKILTTKDKQSSDYSIAIQELVKFSNVDFESLEGVVMSSVVPELTDIIKESLSFLNKKMIVVNDKGVKTGLKVSSNIESEVGSSIISAMVAAKKVYEENFIIIDIRTAITFNIALKGGEYVGSAIFAGPQLSVKALSDNCSKLPLVEVKKPEEFIGNNTIDAIKSGTYYAYLGAIKEIIQNIKEKYSDTEFKIILTGGKSAVFLYDLKFVDAVIPNLTISGLYDIWLLNK